MIVPRPSDGRDDRAAKLTHKDSVVGTTFRDLRSSLILHTRRHRQQSAQFGRHLFHAQHDVLFRAEKHA